RLPGAGERDPLRSPRPHRHEHRAARPRRRRRGKHPAKHPRTEDPSAVRLRRGRKDLPHRALHAGDARRRARPRRPDAEPVAMIENELAIRTSTRNALNQEITKLAPLKASLSATVDSVVALSTGATSAATASRALGPAVTNQSSANQAGQQLVNLWHQ